MKVFFDRRTGRGFGEVSTSHGVVIVQHDAHGLTFGLADVSPPSALFAGEAACDSHRRRCEAACAEARELVEAAGLRRDRIESLYLFGGPATDGMRWVPRGARVPVCFATRRELLWSIGRQELPVSTRVAVALEILARPNDDAAEERATFHWNRGVGRAMWAHPKSLLFREAQTPGWLAFQGRPLAESAQGEVVEADRVGARRVLQRLRLEDA